MTRLPPLCRAAAALLPLLLGLHGAPAHAWGDDGHEQVGAIADALLKGSKTQKAIEAILQRDLGMAVSMKSAALWADCARRVGDRDSDFALSKHSLSHGCAVFATDAGVEALRDFARRNDKQCQYKHKYSQCHLSYHFVDISVAKPGYAETYPGAQKGYGIVRNIQACIAKLKGLKPPPGSVIDIKSQGEALLLLAHYMGDMHQPLHVGAVYLTDKGKRLDPASEAQADKTSTHGGNSLARGSESLHGEWDGIDFEVANPAKDKEVKLAIKQTKQLPDDEMRWPAIWASETVVAARESLVDMKFMEKDAGKWEYYFAKPKEELLYAQHKDDVQNQQVRRAGARLAVLLAAIVPSQEQP